MSKRDKSLPPVPDTTLTYILETYSDRDRLYTQYELARSNFNEWFDQALCLGELSTDPETAIWHTLDVGCGEGLFAAEIISRYPHAHVVGFDRDQEAIMTARSVFRGKKGLHFYTHDALDKFPARFQLESNMAQGDSFDVAIAHLVLMHVRNAPRALNNMVYALKPGGVIYLNDTPFERISFPHPSMIRLCSVVSEAIRQAATLDFADRHVEYLAKAGFVQIKSSSRLYTIGGPTIEGHRILVNLILALKAARRGLVERLHLIDGAEFDEHIRRIESEITLALTGESEVVNTIARKPTGR